MERIKNFSRIKKMLQKGDITYKDPRSLYKYSLCAVCPDDNNECSVSSYERKSGTESSVIRVTFYCPTCGARFDAKPKDMFLC